MLSSAISAYKPVRMFTNPLTATRKPQDAPTPRRELPPVFPTSTNPMPHAHREEVLATALASYGPVFARAMKDREEW